MKILLAIVVSVLAVSCVSDADPTADPTVGVTESAFFLGNPAASFTGDYTVNTVHFTLTGTNLELSDGRTAHDAVLVEACSWSQYIGLTGGEIPDVGIIDAVAGISKPRSLPVDQAFRVILLSE
jgi:hypothetical protein